MNHRKGWLAAPRLLACAAVAIAVAGCLALGACTGSEAAPATSGEDPAAISVATSGTASAMSRNKHAEFGVECSSCHQETDPSADSAPDQTACLSCHGGSYEGLAELTADAAGDSTYAVNPHASHIGAANCTLCHRNHQDSVLYCNDCHTPEFDFVTP